MERRYCSYVLKKLVDATLLLGMRLGGHASPITLRDRTESYPNRLIFMERQKSGSNLFQNPREKLYSGVHVAPLQGTVLLSERMGYWMLVIDVHHASRNRHLRLNRQKTVSEPSVLSPAFKKTKITRENKGKIRHLRLG